MAGPGFLVSYPSTFGPAMLAEGLIQRIEFRLKHDRLRLQNTTLKRMFGKLCVDEKKRAISMLKDMPELKFAYMVLRTKAKINKEYKWNNKEFIVKLVDKVQGIPYGKSTFLDISLIRARENKLMLHFRVFRGIEGKAYATRWGIMIPADIAPDIRNALDRLISRHKAKLTTARNESANKYPTDTHSRKRKSRQAEHSENNHTAKNTSENEI